VGKLNPVPNAAFPSRNYRHRRRTLHLCKLHGLSGTFEVIHRNIEGLVHRVIKVADWPRVHDTLRDFLHNHADGIAAMDLFVVPTISFRLLYGLLIMGHGRRQILWFGVTAHPTAEWIANQVTEACGWEQAPRYLIRDRDGAYGEVFIRRLRSMGIRDRPTSPRSPWQNGYAERLIGSIRRECLDHVVVFSERHLRHMLLSYMNYHNEVRTHLSLEKDAPVSRAVELAGRILCRPILGGLHHQYIRI
jgi:transposase InsO family protein